MRMTINDGHGALLRGLRRLMMADPVLAPFMAGDRQLPKLTIEGLASEAWASATFAGQRHRLDLRLRGLGTDLDPVRERLGSRLHDAELKLKGHVLIDLTLTAAETRTEEGDEVCRLSFEALTVED